MTLETFNAPGQEQKKRKVEGSIGVAVIGCGSFSHRHLAGWQKLVEAGQARLEVVCSRNLAKAQAVAAQYSVASAMTDFEDVVRRPEVQAVDICLPHHMHLPAILAAASAGKHVLCEKPLVLNVDEAAKALQACRDAGVVLMTGNGDRFESHARIVKKIIDDGLLGEVNLILERHMLHKDIIAQAARNMEWKLRREMAGGGSLHRDGVYYIDSLRFWAGSEVAHVAGAELDNFLWEPEEIETTAHVLFRFESGAIGVFDMVWCLQGPHKREIIINGTEGSLTLTGGVIGDATIIVHSCRLSRQVLDGPCVVKAFEECYNQRPDQMHPDRVGEDLVIRVPYAFPGGVHAEEIEFLAAIREGREPESNGLDGARNLELVEGAYRAFEQRRTIDFPLVDWEAIISGGF